MVNNAIAAQVGSNQQQAQQSPLQTVLALQKLKQAFPSSEAVANPVKPAAFTPDTD